ncbi:ATP-binding protein [Thermomonas sp. HDW16]|uniref:sensor histidine kinase n=1 Tax=Thermomonas sp. HDW16 TaxID=2714945 RepID=UPI001407E0D5|nr:ATP-binding protein [Thermomonas sp. HDW16]QIL21113.1 ATP-binding protein [Thermomonas sp. HDW16]
MPWFAMLPALVFAMLALWFWRRQRVLRSQLDDLRETASAQLANERRQGAEDERKRLLDDLHDDIGAKLLTLIHTLEQPGQADLVRSVVQDFRDIVSRSHQDACTLLQALGEIREETEARLEAVGSCLDWEQHPDTPDPNLDEQQTLHLFRIAREAVTNALRHGHASRVRMRVRAIGHELLFDVTDDGPGLASNAGRADGRGVIGMRHRAEALNGSVGWEPGTTGGTKVILRFPLPAAPTEPV